MIAFIQPFGLADHSGGSRILRGLLEDAPESFLSICAAIHEKKDSPFGTEIQIAPHPRLPIVNGTRFAPFAYRLIYGPFKKFFAERFEKRLEEAFHKYDVNGVHAIPHGSQFWHAFRVAQRLNLPYHLNVHDDMRYNLKGRPELTELMRRFEQVWREADSCIVISDAMGRRYCEEFGPRDYKIVTDGLTEDMLSPMRARPENRLRMYFMGALHLTYHPNFEQATEALKLISSSTDSVNVSFVLRGSRLPVNKPAISVEHRPYGTEEEVRRDFDDVDVLYFPLPFGDKFDSFTRYSMSTKLVTYLGAGLPIVYHGPSYAAAAQLLQNYGAAVIVDAQSANQVADGFMKAHQNREMLVRNALRMAREEFWLKDQRRTFWDTISARAPYASHA